MKIFATCLLISNMAFANSIFVSESVIDGKISQITKKPQEYVKAGEIVYYLDNLDLDFRIERVPVRAPVSGYLHNLMIPADGQVKKGEKLFSVIPRTPDQGKL